MRLRDFNYVKFFTGKGHSPVIAPAKDELHGTIAAMFEAAKPNMDLIRYKFKFIVGSDSFGQNSAVYIINSRVPCKKVQELFLQTCKKLNISFFDLCDETNELSEKEFNSLQLGISYEDYCCSVGMDSGEESYHPSAYEFAILFVDFMNHHNPEENLDLFVDDDNMPVFNDYATKVYDEGYGKNIRAPKSWIFGYGILND